jgi:hypothetical protein
LELNLYEIYLKSSNATKDIKMLSTTRRISSISDQVDLSVLHAAVGEVLISEEYSTNVSGVMWKVFRDEVNGNQHRDCWNGKVDL